MRGWKDLLTQGLEDDDWRWDWTTLGTLRDSNQKLRARVIAKSPGVWAATPLIQAVNGYCQSSDGGLSSQSRFKSSYKDGQFFRPGSLVAEWQGSGRLLLAIERPFLNLASFVCGMATSTAALVEKVKEACPQNTPRVTSTRKILPGYRELSIHGVLSGGGYSHRMSLSGGVLIKENHIAAAGGIRKVIEGVRSIAPHGLKIEIEVRSYRELQEALKAGAEVIMLDNFTPDQVRKALLLIDRQMGRQNDRLRQRPLVEISGGLNEQNIADYAIEGVDVLSVGSLTHSVKAVDLSLLVD